MPTDTDSLALQADGWISGARCSPSPNYNQRPQGQSVSLLVIHNISLPPGQFGGPHVEDLFLNRLDCTADPYFHALEGVRVSSHLLIRRDGELVQFVSLRDRAWHAGRSSFEGRTECNDFSVGIELEGTDHEPFTDQQYDCLLAVTHILMAAFPAITADRIVGHEHIAPERKTDPGPAFDWQRYLDRLSLLKPEENPPCAS